MEDVPVRSAVVEGDAVGVADRDGLQRLADAYEEKYGSFWLRGRRRRLRRERGRHARVPDRAVQGPRLREGPARADDVPAALNAAGVQRKTTAARRRAADRAAWQHPGMRSSPPDAFLGHLTPRADVIVPMANGEPVGLLDALEAGNERLDGVRVHQMHALHERPYIRGAYGSRLRHVSYFLSEATRKAFWA